MRDGLVLSDTPNANRRFADHERTLLEPEEEATA